VVAKRSGSAILLPNNGWPGRGAAIVVQLYDLLLLVYFDVNHSHFLAIRL